MNQTTENITLGITYKGLASQDVDSNIAEIAGVEIGDSGCYINRCSVGGEPRRDLILTMPTEADAIKAGEAIASTIEGVLSVVVTIEKSIVILDK